MPAPTQAPNTHTPEAQTHGRDAGEMLPPWRQPYLPVRPYTRTLPGCPVDNDRSVDRKSTHAPVHSDRIRSHEDETKGRGIMGGVGGATAHLAAARPRGGAPPPTPSMGLSHGRRPCTMQPGVVRGDGAGSSSRARRGPVARLGIGARAGREKGCDFCGIRGVGESETEYVFLFLSLTHCRGV